MPQSFRNRKYTGLVADIGKTALMTDSSVGGGDGGGKAAGQGEGTVQRMPRTQRRKLHVTEAQRTHGSELHGTQYPEGRSRLTSDRSRVRESRMPGSARGRGAILDVTRRCSRLLRYYAAVLLLNRVHAHR